MALGLIMLAVVSTGLAGCGSRSGAAPAARTAPTSAGTAAASPAASALTGAPAATSAGASAPAATPVNCAARLKMLPAAATRVLLVHGESYATAYAAVEAYQKSGSAWQPAFRARAARIGQ